MITISFCGHPDYFWQFCLYVSSFEEHKFWLNGEYRKAGGWELELEGECPVFSKLHFVHLRHFCIIISKQQAVFIKHVSERPLYSYSDVHFEKFTPFMRLWNFFEKLHCPSKCWMVCWQFEGFCQKKIYPWKRLCGCFQHRVQCKALYSVVSGDQIQIKNWFCVVDLRLL